MDRDSEGFVFAYRVRGEVFDAADDVAKDLLKRKLAVEVERA